MSNGIIYGIEIPTFMTRSNMALSAAFASFLMAKNAAIRTLSSPEDQTSRHCCRCSSNYLGVTKNFK